MQTQLNVLTDLMGFGQFGRYSFRFGLLGWVLLSYIPIPAISGRNFIV